MRNFSPTLGLTYYLIPSAHYLTSTVILITLCTNRVRVNGQILEAEELHAAREFLPQIVGCADILKMDGQHYSGLGSILDTESEDTEDTCFFILPCIHFQAFLLLSEALEVNGPSWQGLRGRWSRSQEEIACEW